MLRREMLGSLAAAGLAKGKRKRPNVLLILLDDAGPGDFGCYGQKHIQTPNVDRLAREGMLFTQAYAGGAVCAPSRASLMTGLHQGHAPIRANAGTVSLLESDVILPMHLKRESYVCGGFGKWSMGDAFSKGAPQKKGMDKFFGYLHQTHAHNYYTDMLWNVENGSEQRVATGKRYSADLIAEESFRWLEENARKQFFCYATYTLPHGNFEVPDLGPYAKMDWPEKYKIYAAMVTRADGYIGRLLEILKQKGVEKDTLVLFASDNGGTTPEEYGFSFFRTNLNLRDKKGTVYEGGIRTPMIARQPGRIRAGSRCEEPVAFWDWLPTLVEKAPAGIDGISLQPAFDGKPLPKRPYLYWEQNGFNIPKQQWQEEAFRQAVRFGNWKAVVPKPGAPVELYDLGADPSEKSDLAREKPEVAAQAVRYMKEAHVAPRSHAGGSAKWVL